MGMSWRHRSLQRLAMALAVLSGGTCLAGGTQLVRSAGASPLPVHPSVDALPKALSVDAMSPVEIDRTRRGLLSHLQRTPFGRQDGVDGCMQWVFLRHGATEPWMAVGFALPWLGVGAVKLNGALRSAQMVYAITPATSERRSLQGAVSVPGTRPGSGAMAVTSLADRSDLGRWFLEIEDDRRQAGLVFAGTVPATQRYLRLAPVSQLRVSSLRMRCTLLAADCRRYVSDLDDDARWMRPGRSDGDTTPGASAQDRIPLSTGSGAQLAIEDMCPFSRLAMVEGPVNTRAAPVQRGIADHGIPGNASLGDALGNK